MSDKDKKDKKDEKGLGDIFKKIVNTGVTAAFMTEDAVKNIIQELPLPKEMAQGLLQNAKNTKEEFVSSVKSELKEYLNKFDVSKEVDRILAKYDIEVNAKIKLSPKEKAGTDKATEKKK